jgi:hypothetical protein
MPAGGPDPLALGGPVYEMLGARAFLPDPARWWGASKVVVTTRCIRAGGIKARG